MLETGQYFLTRYDDVHDALKDGGERLHNFAHEGGMRAPGVIVPEQEQLINEMDGARHTRRRKLLMTALHPRLISGAEPYIRDLSARLLAPMLERGSGDLVAEFTHRCRAWCSPTCSGSRKATCFKAWGKGARRHLPTLNRTERGEGPRRTRFSSIDGLSPDELDPATTSSPG
jgi:hypothetical protein